ncbi:uncharacterized protein BcabD6B2_31090 [Babesia caballi]|uniref:Uncharacterized protein n=1 Tax=Babesia caballi TaxID=5871 RepID=A0AAV4LYT8_BABCB|nr:hypothetical protein BcabD6B2_31090 [Babesia caballi]
MPRSHNSMPARGWRRRERRTLKVQNGRQGVELERPGRRQSVEASDAGVHRAGGDCGNVRAGVVALTADFAGNELASAPNLDRMQSRLQGAEPVPLVVHAVELRLHLRVHPVFTVLLDDATDDLGRNEQVEYRAAQAVPPRRRRGQPPRGPGSCYCGWRPRLRIFGRSEGKRTRRVRLPKGVGDRVHVAVGRHERLHGDGAARQKQAKHEAADVNVAHELHQPGVPGRPGRRLPAPDLADEAPSQPPPRFHVPVAEEQHLGLGELLGGVHNDQSRFSHQIVADDADEASPARGVGPGDAAGVALEELGGDGRHVAALNGGPDQPHDVALGELAEPAVPGEAGGLLALPGARILAAAAPSAASAAAFHAWRA